MAVFGFLILFGLSCVLFPCEGKINLPPDGDSLVFLPGSTAEIEWSFNDDPATVFSLTWNFKSRKGTEYEIIAVIIQSGTPQLFDRTLTGVEIRKPATLILNNVNESYNGFYRFELKPLTGSTDTSDVTVYIAKKPTVTFSCSSPVTVNEGDDFKCVCRGEGGNPPANVTWHDKDDVQIGEMGKEEQTLTLNNVDKTASGTYKCVAQSHIDANYKDENSIEVKVRLNFKPNKTVVKFKPEKAVLGKSVVVSCESNGLPEPSYAIFHNDTKVSTDKPYTISKVKRSDAGTYKCVATNELGNHSASANLTVVEQGPTTTISPKSTDPVGPKDDNVSDGGLSGGAIAGIIIGVLVLIAIIVVVVYCFCCKSGEKDGYRGNANVIPGGKGESHYELDDNKQGGRGENTYDTANSPRSDNGASGSKSKPVDTLPAVYSTVDRDNREGKPLYATLDTAALRSNGSKKQDEDRPEPTQYASIDHGRVAEVPKADLV